MRAVLDLGRVHHCEDIPPGGGAVPRPERGGFLLAVLLLLPQLVHHVELVKRRVRHGHGPIDAAFPLLERLERHGLARKVDLLRRHGQGLGNAATGIMQERTEGADFYGELPRRYEKGGAFLGGEIEPVSFRIMQA